MALRISGINLEEGKNIGVALTGLYGIGVSKSREILKTLSIDEYTKTRDLTDAQNKQLRDYIETNLKVEGELKREVMQNIKHLSDVQTYRGTRHTKKLPSRGQRTRTNTRTVRGNVRRTVGSGRKAAAEKT